MRASSKLFSSAALLFKTCPSLQKNFTSAPKVSSLRDQKDELFNIRIRQFGDVFITIDKFGVSCQGWKTFRPSNLSSLPSAS
ncbi:unnamed protein product, partial [Vitis vinifera]